MPTRTITGTVLYPDGSAWVGGKVKFQLIRGFATTDEYFPAETHTEVLDSSGQFSTEIGVPDSGTVEYKITTPDKVNHSVDIGDGETATLQELLAETSTEVTTNGLQVIVDSHVSSYLHSQFNVKAHGATGDGETDDKAAIQSAIDAAEVNGGIVFFPPGTYLITDELDIDSSNVSLVGSGAGATTIIMADGYEDKPVFIVGDGETTCAHIVISDMLITSTNQKTDQQAIKLLKTFKVWLFNLRIEKQYNGIHAMNSTQTWLRDSDIRDTSNDAIIWESEVESGYDFYINNVVADNPDVTNAGNGINWMGGENFVIQNCDFLNFVTGFHIHPATDYQCRFGFFVNSEFDFASDNCIKITGTEGGDIIGMNFTNSWSGSATNYGVVISNGGGGDLQGIRFTAHKSFHNGLAGFRLDGGNDIHLLGCDAIGNSQTTPNSRSGIEVSSNVGSHWSILNCKSGNGYQQGDTQDHGISLDGSHTYSNVMIAYCDLSNNTNAGLNLNTGAEIDEGAIVGNLGEKVNSFFEDGTVELWLRNTDGSHISKILDDGNLHIEGESQNIWLNGASSANVLLATGGGKVGIGNDNPGSVLSITGLPTSSSGLSAGDVWNDGGTLKIVTS